MGNYKNLETEFIERTLKLIYQYESRMKEYEYDEQFNHTLLINCLLGLIVFPKEKIIDKLPENLLDKKMRITMGLINSTINSEIIDLKNFVHGMRNSIAHFDISFESDNNEFKIDRIIFRNNKLRHGYIVATFIPKELLDFVRYYSNYILDNINNDAE